MSADLWLPRREAPVAEPARGDELENAGREPPAPEHGTMDAQRPMS